MSQLWSLYVLATFTISFPRSAFSFVGSKINLLISLHISVLQCRTALSCVPTSAVFWLPFFRRPQHVTYLLTPWNRVLLEKLTGSAASQEILRIFGTRKFLTVLPSARHLSLSIANSIQSPTTPSNFLKIHLNIILPYWSGSSQWSLSLRFPHQNPVHTSPLPHTQHMPRPSHSSRFYHPHNIG